MGSAPRSALHMNRALNLQGPKEHHKKARPSFGAKTDLGIPVAYNHISQTREGGSQQCYSQSKWLASDMILVSWAG